MPFIATTISDRSQMNRRSCEYPTWRKNPRNVDLELTHRSIHSDPGVFELLNRISDRVLISDRIMKKIEAAKADLSACECRSELYYPAGLNDSFSRRAAVTVPTYKLYPTAQCLHSLDVVDRGIRRRAAGLDSNKLYNQGRVISTSLSSSTASVYSEDDLHLPANDFFHTPSVASECPSVASMSRRNSFSYSEDDALSLCSESSTLKRSPKNDSNNNNSENTKSHGVVKIDCNLLLVDLSNSTQEQDASSQCALQNEESITTMSEALSVENVPLSLQPREALSDNEDEEYEQCALSEMWHLEEDGHRWSRMDSKASSIGRPRSRLPSSARKYSMDEIIEDAKVDAFTIDVGYLRSMNEENSSSDGKLSHDVPQKNLAPAVVDGNKVAFSKPSFKPKSNFLKRVGGDLKKLSSFRKRDLLQRANSIDGNIDSDRPSKNRTEGRSKGWRKNNRKVVIGDPVLQSGQDRVEQMHCIPIESTSASLKDLHNQHRARKNSSHSLLSSSSSGGASTASTPASRTRVSTEEFSSDLGEISPGIYNRNRAVLEMNVGANVTLRQQKEAPQERDNSQFVIPRSYKPGTFPASLREKSDPDELALPFSSPSSTSSTRSHSVSDSAAAPPVQERKLSRPMSIYDNLPDTALQGNASAEDFLKFLDPGSSLGGVDDTGMYEGSIESLEASVGFDTAFWSVNNLVEQTESLQQMVRSWKIEDEEEEDSNRDDPVANHYPLPASVLPSYSTENISVVDDDLDSNSVTSSDPCPQPRLRWNSLKYDNSNLSESLQLHTLSVGQLMMLRRLSMLKLTAHMENYAFSNTKGTLGWSIPRFMRRMKVPDYKDKIVFGVPLLQNVQRYGQPIPLCIQHALGYLRSYAMDQVGLFRKPGVRARIQKLKEKCENHPELQNFDECSTYDIADLVKQYFRELPDPLMTMKMSDTFIGIFLYVPHGMRLQTLQLATMLLPDERRETLKTLLTFLSDVSANSELNRMTASNLATCFAPSLFHQQISNIRLMGSSTSPKVRKSQAGKMAALNKPDVKEMNDNKASNECLAFMIEHVDDLFKICEDAMTQCRLSVMQQTEDVLATEIGYSPDHPDEEGYFADFHSYVDRVVAQTVREEQRISQNKGNWQSVASVPGCELMFKKLNDGNPLRLWRSQIEINGVEPQQIMERILNERHLWDDDLLQWKVLQQPDERTHLFQTVRAEMSPHPTRDYCVLRSWRTDINSRAATAIVEVSTGQKPLLGDVRGVILTSRYIIEPTDTLNKCTLTHVCRVDTKGRNPEWYNKAYGHVVTQQLIKIRDSLKSNPPRMITQTK